MKRMATLTARRAIFLAAASILALSASDRAAAQGTTGNDSLTGGPGADVINGIGGSDTIYGRDGADLLSGGALYDELYGEAHNDTLNGDGGDDALIGGNDDDVLNGGGGPDYLLGDDFMPGNGGADTLNGGDQDDDLRGGPGADVLNGGNGNDLLHGSAYGGADGADGYDGGAGVDRVSFYDRNATQAAAADLTLMTISNDGFGNAETMTGIEELGGGTQYPDVFIGDAGANALWGMSGDTLEGRDGDDTLGAGGALAIADGGAGFDRIYFQSQRLHDKNGDGVPEQDATTIGVKVDLAAGTAIDGWGVQGQILNVERVHGTAYADTLSGGDGGDQLFGEDGDDALDGAAGPDTLVGGLGNDAFYRDSTGDQASDAAGGGVDIVYASVQTTLPANIENLTLTGTASLSGSGNALGNVILGNSANNTLNGLGGADTLTGAAGRDFLKGGAGPDVFAYNAIIDSPVGNLTRDVINLFESGVDKIDLSAVNAGVYTAIAAFTAGGAPEFTIVQSGGSRIVKIDDNGDGTVDMEIRVPALVAPSDVIP